MRGGSVTGDGYVGGVIGDGVSAAPKQRSRTPLCCRGRDGRYREFRPACRRQLCFTVTNAAFYCERQRPDRQDSGKNTTGTSKTTAELKEAAILTKLGSAFGIYAGADGLKTRASRIF